MPSALSPLWALCSERWRLLEGIVERFERASWPVPEARALAPPDTGHDTSVLPAPPL
jgi:hypothetical protein